jgi:uncharacterized membrane protein
MLARILTSFRHGFSVPQILIAFSFLLGLLLVFIVPPFQKADENTHFYKAISVSSGTLICQKKDSSVFQNPLPKYLADFPTQALTSYIASSADSVFPKSLYTTLLFQRSFDRSLANEPSSCSLPFILYVPLGIALFLPVQLGMNPLFIFFLGRLVHFALAFALFLLAYRVAPKKTKLIPLFILSLPIVLYQISSFSKDALHLSCGVLAFCYLISFLKKKTISPKEAVIFFIVSAITILARPQYALYALLTLLIPFVKVKSHQFVSKVFPLLFIAFILGVISLFLSLEIYSAKATSLGNTTPNIFVYPKLQLQYLQENWIQVPSIIIQTFEQNSIFYLRSAVGILGWLEYRLPWFVYLFYIGLGVYVFSRSKDELPKISFAHFILLNIVVVGTIIGILLSFYLYASPVGAETVVGVQGRYFLLLIPYIFWIFSSLYYFFRKRFLVSCLILIFLTTGYTISARYYDTTHHYYRGGKDIPKVNQNQLVAVTQPLQHQITLEGGKKLRGISFFTFKQKPAITKPYQLEILDESCTRLLRKVIINARSYQENGWNDILISPLEDTGSICIRISPYITTVRPEESLHIPVDESNKPILIPVYLN